MTRTLLIADDSMIIRRMIRDAAADAGWAIAGEAANGQEALDRYLLLRPDAVTLDLVMPGSDGLYALRSILQADPHARVLVVSALDQKGVLKEAFRHGAADFVLKPFDNRVLLEALQRLVPQEAAGVPG